MAKSGKKYLFGILICSLVSIGCLIQSLANKYWITSQPVLIDSPSSLPSKINYGLFSGSYERFSVFNQSNQFSLTITCLVSENVCAWSCLSSQDARIAEVKKLYEEGTAEFSCKAVEGSKRYQTEPSNPSKKASTPQKRDSSRFINAGMWISTITFLVLSELFSLIGCGFTILNIFTNPIETYASVFGLYIWFGISACSGTLVLILWGVEFGVRVTNNIAILDTIIPDYLTSKGHASLGYSYFLIIVAIIENLVAIGLVYYRDYVLNKQREQSAIPVDRGNNDDLIY